MLGCIFCLALPAPAKAQDHGGSTPRPPSGIEDPSWAQFEVGSWKLVRISKEVFGRDGQLESMTIQEGKTTLTAVQEDRFTLMEEITLEVAGKRFKSAARTIERGRFNEPLEHTVTTKRLEDSKVVICGREFPSQVHQITLKDANSILVSKVHYSPELEPFILKRDTIGTDLSGEITKFEATVEVLAFNMPHRVLAEIKPSTHLKTVHVQGDQTTVILEVSCPTVPGHIVAHTKKVTAKGRLTERSTLELLEYEVASKQAASRGLGRTRLIGKRRLRGNSR